MIDFILHFDRYLKIVIENYGILTYLFLFLIVFCETGLVVMPFLPGDSLIFVAGTFAAQGSLSIGWLLFLLSIAAIAGDTINYFAGTYLKGGNRFIKKEHLEKTHYFFEKYGKKTIFIARFIPIVRTLAPFVAGVSKMDYKTFIFYNIIGGLTWVFLFASVGYFFGNVPVVKENLTMVIFGIIFISILPPLVEWLKEYVKKSRIKSGGK